MKTSKIKTMLKQIRNGGCVVNKSLKKKVFLIYILFLFWPIQPISKVVLNSGHPVLILCIDNLSYYLENNRRPTIVFWVGTRSPFWKLQPTHISTIFSPLFFFLFLTHMSTGILQLVHDACGVMDQVQVLKTSLTRQH